MVHTFILDLLSVQKVLTDWYFGEFFVYFYGQWWQKYRIPIFNFWTKDLCHFFRVLLFLQNLSKLWFQTKKSMKLYQDLQDGENPNFSKQTVVLHTYFTLLLIFQLSYIQYAKCYNDKTCKEKYFPYMYIISMKISLVVLAVY